MRNTLRIVFLGSLAASCAEVAPLSEAVPGAQRTPVAVEDLADESGKGDGSVFDMTWLMEDTLFEDTAYLTAAQVQAFFVATPYGGGRRSFLADTNGADGRPVSTHLVEIAARHAINLLVLMVKLQVEASLVAAASSPSTFLVDRAMGCGCHDGDASCSNGQKGLVPQIECAAREFRRYLTDIDTKGQTVSGWSPGKAKNTSEGISLRPRNRATAALYTYTPWVLRNTGGNWLFWNVFHRYERHIFASSPNHRFIGGTCTTDNGCDVLEGLCLTGASESPFCTRPCDRYCPDSTAAFTATTFCADLGTSLSGIPGGFCLSRCDSALFPQSGGCAAGFLCSQAERYGEPGVLKDVCWPVPR